MNHRNLSHRFNESLKDLCHAIERHETIGNIKPAAAAELGQHLLGVAAAFGALLSRGAEVMEKQSEAIQLAERLLDMKLKE